MNVNFEQARMGKREAAFIVRNERQFGGEPKAINERPLASPTSANSAANAPKAPANFFAKSVPKVC